jgi:hypothetical protein
MRISRCGLPPAAKEVRLMIENTMIYIIYILFFSLIVLSFIAFALIAWICVFISKS